MQPFRCPSCDEPAISVRRKWGSTSLTPTTCPSCRASVYVSGRLSSLWRTVEALLVTLIVIRLLIGFSWSLVVLGVLVIVVIEAAWLWFVPLVTLRRKGFD